VGTLKVKRFRSNEGESQPPRIKTSFTNSRTNSIIITINNNSSSNNNNSIVIFSFNNSNCSYNGTNKNTSVNDRSIKVANTSSKKLNRLSRLTGTTLKQLFTGIIGALL